MSKSVIIHGRRVSRLSPRHGREDHELWGVARGNTRFWSGQLLDWTRWFDLHPIDDSNPSFVGIEQRRPATFLWYCQQTAERPIYLQHHDPRIPGSVEFPLHALQQYFAIDGQQNTHFTCQIDYMIAFALMEGFDHIILNGIGTAETLHHYHLHRGIPYWMGVTRGMGRRITLEGPSIFRSPDQLYGYEIAGTDTPLSRAETREIRRLADRRFPGEPEI